MALINKIKKKVKKIVLKKLENSLIISNERLIKALDEVRICSSSETLISIQEAIVQKKVGAYFRFGDGDVYLLLGKDDVYQAGNSRLMEEMEEAFSCNSGTLHKCLALHSIKYGYERNMLKGMHIVSDKQADYLLRSTFHYFIGKNIYSPVALHYAASFNVELCLKFLKFLKSQNPIFVGNKNFSPEMLNILFAGERIKTPSVNAYEEIERIETELINLLLGRKNQFQLIVISMGCAGRILQKRILNKGLNVYLFDFGSLLDAFAENPSRTWIKMSNKNNFREILRRME